MPQPLLPLTSPAVQPGGLPEGLPSSALPAEEGGLGLRLLTIDGHEGTPLSANLFEPTGVGPHPAVVFINSWGLDDGEYLAQAARFAAAGYVVLSYTTRGFWTSGGSIDVAGPHDVADASAVIDWLLAQTSADPARIGLAGISYGSGISLLAAAHDPRVRAVAALSTWGDLAAALLPNGTWSRQAIALLEIVAGLTGRPSETLQELLGAYHDNDRDTARRLVAARSPVTHVAALNRNQPAILLANGWSDAVFPAGQLVDFFGRLSVPKRLELAPGGHGMPELLGLAGLPDQTWTSVHLWFDHHLLGAGGDLAPEHAVRVRPTLGGGWMGYGGWAELSGSRQVLRLGEPVGLRRTGSLSADAAADWSYDVAAGFDTIATGGVPLLTGGGEALGLSHLAWLPGVVRRFAGVWSSEILVRALQVRGAPRVHVTLTASARRATVVAYLYDVDLTGTGRLLTHQPYTLLGADPGRPEPVDIVLDPVVHDVRPAHRLALVVDTVDELYRGESRIGSTVRFSSPPSDPALLDVPLA